MKTLISLIIPVYNVVDYFDKCMESVLSQTYENYEVILVDDGSTDGCGEKCDRYAELDKRVKAYHQKNQGLSAARNFGVCQANAEYISFVDSDDYISNDYLEYLYDLKQKFDAGMSSAGIYKVYSDKNDIMADSGAICAEKCISAEEALKLMCYDEEISVSASGKLYRKSQVLKHPYPEGRLYEDLATTCKLVAENERIAVSDKPIYYYLIRKGSIMQREMNSKQMDIVYAADEQLNYIRAVYPALEQAARIRRVKAILGMMTRCSLFSAPHARMYYKSIRDCFKQDVSSVMKDHHVGFLVKIQTLIVLMGFYPSKLAWFLKKKLRQWGKESR